ncbi:hypothetical protein B5M47_02290 [candidate division CPR3 bacterium 4484_211]|uniref:Cation-transporting P-type ATPase N-terminal domain-containing protein n=1 Tax=candidate division CPR3 bacterium 4484_211 TaxID=1968527 RepID=A0A1W9NY25_UNCC3|nr:MAG: hypothetical protein B5M47_02290 [candidate division CPR3 bacterium 4484_211]
MHDHALSISEIQKELKVNPKQGLFQEEAQARLKKFGLNQLPEEKLPTSLEIFISQFKSPLVYILLFAALISIVLQHWGDTLVIAFALFLNTILGFIQEKKALNILSKLKKLVHFRAKLIRDSRETAVPAEEVVPGDLLILEAGDRVVADARLIKENDLEVIEAALTGESAPSEKNTGCLPTDTPVADRENMVFAGTVVSKGRGQAIVVATGKNTELGKIALLVSETKDEKTPLQEQLSRFSGFLTRLVSALCLFIFVIGVWQGKDWFEMLTTSIAIAVAAIPEGLLVALTAVLALGMQRILRRQGLVRKLIAAETLGSTSVICSDKTGTLTKGEMQMVSINLPNQPRDVDISPQDEHKARAWVFKISVLCNNAIVQNREEKPAHWKIIGSPTERALLLASAQAGNNLALLKEKNPRLGELPFNENRKFMATLNLDKSQNKKFLLVKGAPELILKRATRIYESGNPIPLTQDQKQSLLENIEKLSAKGLRILGMGYKEWALDKNEIEEKDANDLIYIAFVSLRDPLREDARQTIDLCRKAGITPVIVTGDHLLTAKEVAREAGIVLEPNNMIEGKELEKLSDEELASRVRDIKLYARVTPTHKLRIIDAWQKEGEVVAMTGDGVNDAPALKKADIGVALGSGTEVAKEASDLVLLDDKFSTIVAAIKEGRVIFDNLRKIITYLLADAFSEMVLITGTLLMHLFSGIELPTPILAGQILWINLITDGLPNLALTVEPQEKDIMNFPPRKKGEDILNLEMKTIIFVISLFTDLILFGLFVFLWRSQIAPRLLRSIMFGALGIDSLFYVFSCKSLRRPLWKTNPFSNRWLVGAIGGGWLLQLLPFYYPPLRSILKTVPLPAHYWIILIGIALFKVFCIELVKEVFIHREKNTN